MMVASISWPEAEDASDLSAASMMVAGRAAGAYIKTRWVLSQFQRTKDTLSATCTIQP